ncbi:hypothetical protein [uncultured Propionibacterium sp.]|uniref:hypothetical protein n=1 Tax=uncultured Propionibacterium sp. TaxID=218066 RepID=UPI00292D0842|nr:hypothetical protein [uncultured Propionibacterium sp.]
MSAPPLIAASAPRPPAAVQHALVLVAAVCTWGAVPRPAAPPGAWMWDADGIVLAASLVLARRHQPHIDDRDLDRTLGLGGLLTAAWIVFEWDTAVHPFAANAAAGALALGCLFWVLGTRETCWALPAALAPLLGAVPALGAARAGAVGLALCLLTGTVVVLRRGPAPAGQLDPVVPGRLVVPAVAAGALLLVVRGWVW